MNARALRSRPGYLLGHGFAGVRWAGIRWGHGCTLKIFENNIETEIYSKKHIEIGKSWKTYISGLSSINRKPPSIERLGDRGVACSQFGFCFTWGASKLSLVTC